MSNFKTVSIITTGIRANECNKKNVQVLHALRSIAHNGFWVYEGGDFTTKQPMKNKGKR